MQDANIERNEFVFETEIGGKAEALTEKDAARAANAVAAEADVPENTAEGATPVAKILPEAVAKQRVRAPKSKKADQLMTPRRIYLWGFLVPLLTIALAFLCNGFYPVGPKTPLTIDLFHQYAPFLAELRRKMLSFDSIFFSWHIGLGTNFFALFSYYLASPLNLLLLFFPPDFLSEAVSLITCLKVGLIGLSTSMLLLHAVSPAKLRTIGEDQASKLQFVSQVGTDYLIVALSSAFALSGFVMAYSWNIMWLDSIALFPLVILFMIKLIQGGKIWPYSLVVALCLMCSYYVAFFVAAFTILYFPVALVSFRKQEYADFKSTALIVSRWVLGSLLGVLLAAVMIYPTYLSLKLTSATNDTFPATFKLAWSYLSFLERHLILNKPAIRDGLPNVYTGVISMILLPLYIFCKEIQLKEKVAHLSLLFFMFLSFNTNYLDFIWHGMHYPNQLPFRYAFVYSLLLVIIGYRALSYIRTASPKLILAVCTAGVLFALLAEEIFSAQIEHWAIYVNIVVFVIYALVLKRFSEPGGLRNFRNTSYVLAVVIIMELILNSLVSVVFIHTNEYYTSRSDFNNDFAQSAKLIEQINAEDKSFFRMEMNPQKTCNSPALYGYNGFTVFSSSSASVIAKTMSSLGYHGNNINSYKYVNSTHLLDSFFGIKYLMYKSGELKDEFWQSYLSDEQMHVYKNEKVVGPGLVLPKTAADWTSYASTPFLAQNNLAARSGSPQEVYLDREVICVSGANYGAEPAERRGLRCNSNNTGAAGTLEFSITAQKDEHMYFYLDTNCKIDVSWRVIPVAGSENKIARRDDELRFINEPELFDCGQLLAGDTVSIKITTKENATHSINVYAAAEDKQALTACIDNWQQNSMKLTSYSSTNMKGTIDVNKRGILLFTIPYDPGWSLYIDGQKQQINRLDRTFMYTEVVDGHHEVELRFMPQGFLVGVGASAAALVVLIALIVLAKRKKRRQSLVDLVAVNAEQQE